MAGPFTRTDPSLAATATLYVSTTGNDSNSGQSWDEPFATIQAAINALPATGGLVEVGSGSFAGFSISGLGQQQIKIRGRGIGDYYYGGANTALTSVSSDPTVITNSNAATSAVVVNGGSTNGNNLVFVLEDIAVQGVPLAANTITFAGTPPANLASNWTGTTGNYVVKLSTGQMTVVLLTNGSTTAVWLRDGIQGTPSATATYVSTADGLNLTDCTHCILRRVVTKFHGGHGINIPGGSYWFEMDSVHAMGNANDGFFATGTNTANVLFAINSKFNSNGLNGADTGTGYAQNWISDDFSNNGTSLSSAMGTGIKVQNGGPYNVLGCFFEKNFYANILLNGGALTAIGTVHFGDGTYPQYGILTTSSGGILNASANNFGGGCSVASIINQGTPGVVSNNISADTNFQWNYNGAQSNGSAPHVVGALANGTFNNQTVFPQTLSSAGAVTFDASKVIPGGYQQVTLGANATSSSITNPTVSQTMTIQWIENSTGGFTYAWPTTCKFAGGSAPSGTTLSTMNSVTFVYDGTNWVETARSTAVPYP